MIIRVAGNVKTVEDSGSTNVLNNYIHKMTRIYWLLIFHIDELETKLFMTIAERKDYIKNNSLTPTNYRLFDYEVKDCISDLDEEYTNNYF